jgi:hypothetical protein
LPTATRHACPPSTNIPPTTSHSQLRFPARQAMGDAQETQRAGKRRDRVRKARTTGRLPPRTGNGPRGRWRWPRTHPRGPTGRVGAGPKVRVSPEMRPGSHDDWAATPKRASVILKDVAE